MKNLTIQEVHTYLQLAEKGIVAPLQCIVNPDDHLGLLPDIDENENVYLYCLSCNSKLKPGLTLINTIKKCINKNIQLL